MSLSLHRIDPHLSCHSSIVISYSFCWYLPSFVSCRRFNWTSIFAWQSTAHKRDLLQVIWVQSNKNPVHWLSKGCLPIPVLVERLLAWIYLKITLRGFIIFVNIFFLHVVSMTTMPRAWFVNNMWLFSLPLTSSIQQKRDWRQKFTMPEATPCK